MKVKALACNLREIELKNWEEEGGSATMIIIQPEDIEKASICPLAIACGLLVSGYAYVFKNKADAEKVIELLK